jgi:hypothetical protein
MKRFDFVHMRPENGAVHGGLPPGATVRALVKPGQDYLIYLRTGVNRSKTATAPKTEFGKGELAIEVTLPAGDFKVEWLDPKTARVVEGSTVGSKGGARQFSVPAFEEDVVLTINRQ